MWTDHLLPMSRCGGTVETVLGGCVARYKITLTNPVTEVHPIRVAPRPLLLTGINSIWSSA